MIYRNLWKEVIQKMRVTDNALISALLSSPTIKSASEQVGLSEQAVYQRLRKEIIYYDKKVKKKN